jgi:hypothetical protein
LYPLLVPLGERVRAARLRKSTADEPLRAAAPVWIVHTADDATHAAYRAGALRTLCGQLVERGVSGGGQRVEPTCERCCRTLAEHRKLGLAVQAGATSSAFGTL